MIQINSLLKVDSLLQQDKIKAKLLILIIIFLQIIG